MTILDIHDDLMRAANLQRVVQGGPEERLWLDCDLACLAENRLGDTTDPRALDDARRAEWQSRASTEQAYPLSAHEAYARCYWLTEDGQRKGTVSLGTDTGGSLRLSSLYVFSTDRGRGVARRALSSMQAVLAPHRLGLRLETDWSWQRSVHFYVRFGMWLRMWKRDLQFAWHPDMPAPRIEVGDDVGSLSVQVDGTEITLARARRRGDVLELDEPPREHSNDPRLGEAYWWATTTLSLSLALRGWPLVRSRELWEECRGIDGGAPEGLARRIQTWEAWEHDHGWIVATPRVAGLEYPTWKELEARWTLEAELARSRKSNGRSRARSS